MENNIEKPKFCSLEMVYLLSKDSKYRGQLLSEYRRKLGIKLSEEFPDLKADFVI
jgi:glutamine phosphoribosylpyrophosphate amidotransferase